ncbi:hypothetical protein B0H21DRAFT_579979 [Amylocystis lapponica]|nr:hypothetical protein B0H21DRAFT_579979 [Amylocystis lapponica]
MVVPRIAGLRGPTDYNTDHHYDVPVSRANVVAQITMFIGVVATVLLGVGRRGSDFLLLMIRLLVSLTLGSRGGGELDIASQNIVSQIPLTINEALSKFKLDGRTTIYAVCPTCHCIYEPCFELGSVTAAYPERCTHRHYPKDDECGASLLEASNGQRRPVKTFVYHHFFDYLAGLVSRADVEEAMDKACDDLMVSLSSGEVTSSVGSPFEAEFLKTFLGPDGRTLFVDRGDEGRYAFALNVDFFNVEGMRIRAGEHVSGWYHPWAEGAPPDGA